MSQRNSSSKSSGTALGPELDIERLHALPSEQQDLYLLTFSADLEREIATSETKDVSARQAYFKQELFKIITLLSPIVSRVIRNILGRAFAQLFAKGDRKVLYETIDGLLAIVNSGKGVHELKAKHVAVHCLGEVFEAAGDSAVSLSAVTSSSILRLQKAAQTDVGFRSSIYRALGKISARLGNSLDETVTRDIWKLVRAASSTEKSYLAQTSAWYCLEQLVTATTYFDNVNDFGILKAAFFKAIDCSVSKIRHAAASTFAATLVKSFSGDVVVELHPKVKKLKKASRRDSVEQEDEDEISQSESPGPKKQATRLSLGLLDLLKQLSSHYVRASTSNKARAGLAACYARALSGLSRDVIEGQYIIIVDHLLNDLLSHGIITSNRYRLLITRKFVQVILEDVIGHDILGESAQLNAAKLLVNNVLKNYPQALKERAEPSKYAITGALSALTALLNSLGSAANAIVDLCRDGLLQILQHPSYTVQVWASSCIRSFALVCPQELLPCATVCMNSVKREVNLLKTPRQSPRKCVGLANGLAALLSTGPERPVYGSADVNLGAWSLANDLLKSSSDSDLRASATQIQVAWIMMGGLMSFGPSFVKRLLPQLSLLWKNALPRPSPREDMVKRTSLELSFLTHVRECALGCMLAFLNHNSKLLTLDLVRRLANLLQNTTAFLYHLPSKKSTDDVMQRLSPSLQLHDHELMVRRRVLQCYATLLGHSAVGSKEILLQADLFTLTTALFAHPDDHTSNSLSTSIASSVGNFESLWEVGDNHGFGVTSLLRPIELKVITDEPVCNNSRWITGRGADIVIDNTLRAPVCGAPEHDSISLYMSSIKNQDQLPDPPSTEVVNSAIKLFAVSLPLQPAKIQESILEQLTTHLSASALHRDPGRKAAITVNIAIALLATVKATSRDPTSAQGDITNTAVGKDIRDILQSLIVHPDHLVRNIASEALGRLCYIMGNAFTANEINQTIEMIVSNREPNARAGCAVALGCIHSQVGGMAAGYHLKTIFSILLSLSEDSHPLVHFWALEALSKVAQSAGLTFSGYVSPALGTLARRYVSDTHNSEIPQLASSNIEFEFPTTTVIGRCLDSLINVLGPDLQDANKVRNLIMTLTSQIQDEEDPLPVVESLRCLEHISMFASRHTDFSEYVQQLQTYLNCSQVDLREAAIDGLYNLIKRDANGVIKVAKDGIADQLWIALDRAPESYGLQRIIRSWLEQTCLHAIEYWIHQCQKVMKQSRLEPAQAPNAKPASRNAIQDTQDDEVAGFAASSGNEQDQFGSPAGNEQEFLKWQVRAFALDCLSELLSNVDKTSNASDSESSALADLQGRLGEVIRIAFSASTSHVVELRIRGVRIIGKVLKMFGRAPDPDFPEASLLDQYQAQISSALTPAFAADSSPELASDAIEVCGTFIGIGIVTKVDRMGRMLRILVSALDDFANESHTASIGDLKNLSPNAQIMVKCAVISAWAGLQVTSKEQQYLAEVVRPYITVLAPLWLSSLKDYARLRFAPDDGLNNGLSLSCDFDVFTTDADRPAVLLFYKDSWLNIMDAVTSLIENDMDTVFDALDRRSDFHAARDTQNGSEINYRDEPVAFFFILFGIVVEGLLARSMRDAELANDEIPRLLRMLQKILRPSVSGQAAYQDTVFSETMDLLNRLALTQTPDVQTIVVEIARDMCLSHPSSKSGQSPSKEGDVLSDEVEQLFELTRIIVVVLGGLLPNLQGPKSNARLNFSDESTSLAGISLDALVSAAEVFPSMIKTDLYACIFYIFYNILGTPACQPIVVPQALPILKQFIQAITTSSNGLAHDDRLTLQFSASLARFLSISNNARRQEADLGLGCEKNSLLASTILMTGGVNIIPTNDPSIQRLSNELLNRLKDPKTSTVAINCIRSLLLHLPRTAADEQVVRCLFPRLIQIITSSGSELSNDDDINNNNKNTVITRISKIITTFISTLSPLQIPSVFRIVIPAFIHRASSFSSSSSPTATTRTKGYPKAIIHADIAAKFLELAAIDQLCFRNTVARLTAAQRAQMEAIIRTGAGSGGRSDNRSDVDEDDNDDDSDDSHGYGKGQGYNGGTGQGSESRKGKMMKDVGPSIALKMDFGT